MRDLNSSPRRISVIIFTIFACVVLLATFEYGISFSRRSFIPPPEQKTITHVEMRDTGLDDLVLADAKVLRTIGQEKKCTIVGCATPTGRGVEQFRKFYAKSGYSVSVHTASEVRYKGKKANDMWCDVPAVRDEIRFNPATRVIYADLDTLIRPREWCDLPDHEHAPIVMNSLYRDKANYPYNRFRVAGSQIQANAFVVTPGLRGFQAIRRWEKSYYSDTYWDQAAISIQEHFICGVPGWIACYSNPEQNFCHCAGFANRDEKEKCIESLFNGTKESCKTRLLPEWRP